MCGVKATQSIQGDKLKAVYIKKKELNLNINGEWIYAKETEGIRRYIYHYGEVPENYVEKYYNEETVFRDLANKVGYQDDFEGYKTLFDKKLRLDLFPLKQGIVYKDALKAFEVEHIYEIVENPEIKWLEEDLGFKGYSELVFDREQELKSMMTKN